MNILICKSGFGGNASAKSQSNIMFVFQITETVVTLHTVHWRVNLLHDLHAVSRKRVRRECTGDRWGARITSSADNNRTNRLVSGGQAWSKMKQRCLVTSILGRGTFSWLLLKNGLLMLINDDSCTFCHRLHGTLPSIMSKKPAGRPRALNRWWGLGITEAPRLALKAAWRAGFTRNRAPARGAKKRETPAAEPRYLADEARLGSAALQLNVSGKWTAS